MAQINKHSQSLVDFKVWY